MTASMRAMTNRNIKAVEPKALKLAQVASLKP